MNRSRINTAGRLALIGWRNATGRSQRAVAVELGIDTSAIAHIERGFCIPRLRHAIKLEQLSSGAVPCMSWEVAT